MDAVDLQAYRPTCRPWSIDVLNGTDGLAVDGEGAVPLPNIFIQTWTYIRQRREAEQSPATNIERKLVRRVREPVLSLGQIAQAVGNKLAIDHPDRNIIVRKERGRRGGKTRNFWATPGTTNKTRRCNVVPRRNQATSATSDCSVGLWNQRLANTGQRTAGRRCEW